MTQIVMSLVVGPRPHGSSVTDEDRRLEQLHSRRGGQRAGCHGSRGQSPAGVQLSRVLRRWVCELRCYYIIPYYHKAENYDKAERTNKAENYDKAERTNNPGNYADHSPKAACRDFYG